jgi:hypothetical protein
VHIKITIAGNNSTISRAPESYLFRIFAVNEAGDLTLERATVRLSSSASTPAIAGRKIPSLGAPMKMSGAPTSRPS